MQRLFIGLLVLGGFCNGQNASLNFSSYLGGSDQDTIHAVAVGPDGSFYVAGTTSSRDFPVLNAWQPACALSSRQSCSDGFLARFASDGRTLLFSTFFGNNSNDRIVALAVDSKGNAVVAGNKNDLLYAFVAVFSPEGRLLSERTLQGSPIVLAHALALGPDGDVYLAGETSGLTLTLPASGYQTAVGPVSCQAIGGSFPLRAFVLRLTSGLAISGGTYFGGSGNSAAKAIAVSADGEVWLGGDTSSTDLPLVNALQPAYGGGHPTTQGNCSGGDGLLARFSPDLSTLKFSSYYGGAAMDSITSVDVNQAGTGVFAGTTQSSSLPGMSAAPRRFSGYYDAFVVRVEKESNSISFATYFGGVAADYSASVRAASDGSIVLTGTTASSDLPLVQALQSNPGGCQAPQPPPCLDLFVARWSERGTLDFATFLGGSGDEEAHAIALTAGGSVVLGGSTAASNFPVVNAFQPAKNGPLSTDAVVALIAVPPPPTVEIVSAACDSVRSVGPSSLAAMTGHSLVTRSAILPYHGFPFAPEGLAIQVSVPGKAPVRASILFASPERIVFYLPLPSDTAAASYPVSLLKDGQEVHKGSLTFLNPSPALFSANGDGRGAAAGLAIDDPPSGVYEMAYRCNLPDGSCSTTPITAGGEGKARVLILYGTGCAYSLQPPTAVIGSVKVQVLLVRPSGVPGVDEIRLSLPAALAGAGRSTVVVMFGGRPANEVEVEIR